ncbi:hypothetical protein LSH36_547g02013 [Paralvinella palmiformis]|uniref:Uncharacterized protein n=1 Tax=Paralvinella palmiformis TaxID=53620 RepID=A0AAD9J6T3_9ANNE|nr:hypothetical protein LSH36_547g02013 [Paralvinella palmiformis]
MVWALPRSGMKLSVPYVGMQIVHPCTETLCMTANDCPGDIDIYNDIVPSDWRVNQPLWSVSTPRNPSNWSVWSICLWNFPKNKEVPVYVVRGEAGDDTTRTLHRNLLLPIGSLPLDETDAPDTVDNVHVVEEDTVTNTVMNSPDTGTDEVDTSGEEDYTLVATESPFPDDCTGGDEHIHGDSVEQSPLLAVLTDPPATPVLVDVDEHVQIGIAYSDVLSNDETPVLLPHVERPVPAPRRSSRIKA